MAILKKPGTMYMVEHMSYPVPAILHQQKSQIVSKTRLDLALWALESTLYIEYYRCFNDKKKYQKFVFLREGNVWYWVYTIFINFCLILMNVYFPSILIFSFQMKYLIKIQRNKRKTN